MGDARIIQAGNMRRKEGKGWVAAVRRPVRPGRRWDLALRPVLPVHRALPVRLVHKALPALRAPWALKALSANVV